MTPLIHDFAALLYLLAAGFGLRALRSRQGGDPGPWLLGAGSAVHAYGFAALHWQEVPLQLDSFPAALSLIGWLVAVTYLLSLGFARVRGVGTWVGGAAGGFTLVAGLSMHLWDPAVAPGAAADSGIWSHAHVLLSTLGFSLLALASLGGLAYLTKRRSLKRKSPVERGLPSLESLDRMQHLTLTVGFALLTLGVITGFAWGINSGLSPWTGHSLWLLAAWAVYLLPLGTRVIRRQHGDRPARSAVAGFALLAFAYIGIRLLGGPA